MTESSRRRAEQPSAQSTKSPAQPRISPQTTATTVVESPQEKATNYALGVILQKLKSPATAKLVEAKIVAADDPWFQIHAVFDAQNSFGALIRSHFLCVVKMGDQSQYSQSLFGIWEHETGWSEEKLELHRTINHWGE